MFDTFYLDNSQELRLDIATIGKNVKNWYKESTDGIPECFIVYQLIIYWRQVDNIEVSFF